MASPPPVKQPVPFNFQTAKGQPLANGRVVVRLDIPSAVVTDVGEIAGLRVVSGILDNNGSATLHLWANDVIQPTSLYLVRAYSEEGQLVWQGTINVVTAENDLLQESSDPFLLETGGTNHILLET